MADEKMERARGLCGLPSFCVKINLTHILSPVLEFGAPDAWHSTLAQMKIASRIAGFR